jgi:hypothetical protein
MYPGDVPFSWKVTLKSDGEPVDITDSDVSALVYDDGKEVGAMTLEKIDPENGQVMLTFTEALHAAVGRYSTWRFREDTLFNFLLIQGRLVKEA